MKTRRYHGAELESFSKAVVKVSYQRVYTALSPNLFYPSMCMVRHEYSVVCAYIKYGMVELARQRLAKRLTAALSLKAPKRP